MDRGDQRRNASIGGSPRKGSGIFKDPRYFGDERFGGSKGLPGKS